jgi:hypothetical protein
LLSLEARVVLHLAVQEEEQEEQEEQVAMHQLACHKRISSKRVQLQVASSSYLY